jgi:uncharacterized membrane protein
MQLIPSWAPNVHPMLVHFPIVLVLLAAGADVVQLLRPRLGAGRLAPTLYLLGAASGVAAFLTGRTAALEVFIPGMAHGLVDDHRAWALLTTAALVAVATTRVAVQFVRRSDGLGWRMLFAVTGLVLAVLVQQTAERGARLVYEQGVGVIPGPGPEPARVVTPGASEQGTIPSR